MNMEYGMNIEYYHCIDKKKLAIYPQYPASKPCAAFLFGHPRRIYLSYFARAQNRYKKRFKRIRPNLTAMG